MRACLLAFLVAAQSWVAFSQEGALLYVSPTPSNGWQVFHYDFASGASTQLSFSPGDKRTPQWCVASRFVTCRDSLGRILRLEGKNESLLLTNLEGCVNYSLCSDGQAVYFTKPSPENRHQDIWRQALNEPVARLAVSVPGGLLKQVAVSPDGRWLAATHIWRPNEERLILVPAETNGRIEYLTPDRNLDSFPHWTADSKTILFSMVASNRAYAVCSIDPNTKRVKTLSSKDGLDACNPVSDKTGRFIFFEQRNSEGCAIACLDTRSQTITSLSIAHEAREPFWYENKQK